MQPSTQNKATATTTVTKETTLKTANIAATHIHMVLLILCIVWLWVVTVLLLWVWMWWWLCERMIVLNGKLELATYSMNVTSAFRRSRLCSSIWTGGHTTEKKARPCISRAKMLTSGVKTKREKKKHSSTYHKQ